MSALGTQSARPYSKVSSAESGAAKSSVPRPLPEWQLSWAHVAQGLALTGLVLAAGALALGSRGQQLSGLSSNFATSAVLVNPNLRSTAMKRARSPIANGVKGGGFLEGPSIWCFALMLPWGYEPGLLAAQHQTGIGIFACNKYAVFSNNTYPVKDTNGSKGLMKEATPEEIEASKSKDGPLTTLTIGGDLFVEFGGKWWTAMNTDIFIRVWAAVIELGAWRLHAWTVKADPDSVFFPARLRQMVVDEPSGPIYLNNCKFGLHGPIEVLSREGLEAYAKKPAACDKIRSAAMDMKGPWDDMQRAFGEDEFLHRCLDAVGVKRVDELGLLLSETACEQESVPCDEGKVSFHPFKTTQEYFDCWGAGSVSGDAWDKAIAAAPMPTIVSEEVLKD